MLAIIGQDEFDDPKITVANDPPDSIFSNCFPLLSQT
jgi:hypothetical protein